MHEPDQEQKEARFLYLWSYYGYIHSHWMVTFFTELNLHNVYIIVK